jgi:hypothetical protein
MKENLDHIKNNVKPKNRFWKIFAKVGIFIVSMVIKNQKGVNPGDVDKGVEIANKTLE